MHQLSPYLPMDLPTQPRITSHPPFTPIPAIPHLSYLQHPRSALLLLRVLYTLLTLLPPSPLPRYNSTRSIKCITAPRLCHQDEGYRTLLSTYFLAFFVASIFLDQPPLAP